MGALEELPARVAAIESQILQFREEVRKEFSAVRTEMHEMGGQILTQMRVLHDDVIGRIKLLGER